MLKKAPQSRYLQIQLPQTEYPTAGCPSFFYKTKQRLENNRLIILMGLKLHTFTRFQEDHILFLMQAFNLECPRLKLHLIHPKFIYAEVRRDGNQQQDCSEDAIEVEGRLMDLLGQVQEHFTTFIKENLSQQNISANFDSQTFMLRFTHDVIRKVKQKEIGLFWDKCKFTP